MAADVFAQLDRYGVVTRGSVLTENAEGGFGAAYRALSSLEESGQCRRGYFVEGLGAAQFASDRRRRPAAGPAAGAGASRRLWCWRPATRPTRTAPRCPGPSARATGPAVRPGALVVLVDGALVFYVERGGKTLLSFTEDPARLAPAADALARAVRQGSWAS